MIACMSEKNTAASPAIDDIRRQIDALDDRIHDALMARAELVLKIAEEKKKKKLPVVQPAREARLIRRLLGRHTGDLPKMAVVRIWREVIGAVSMLQADLKVVVVCEAETSPLWDMARDYFGSTVPVTRQASALSAVSLVRENKADFAVLPWPQDDEGQPWWSYLDADQADQRIAVTLRLPHGDEPGQSAVDGRGLVIGKTAFQDSGDDHSFLLIQCSGDVSRGRLVDHAKKIGIEAISLVSSRPSGPYTPALHLMEVAGYMAHGDDRCRQMADMIEGDEARVLSLGGFPVPPVYEKSVHPAPVLIPKAPKEGKAG